MAKSCCRPLTVSTMVALRSLAGTRIKPAARLTQALVMTAVLSFASTSYAQPVQATSSQLQTISLPDSPSSTPNPEGSGPIPFKEAAAETTVDTTAVIVPAGARIALVLTHPIQSRYVHRGDDIYAQVTSPVNSGNEVVIPPGTFVQGKVDKLERKGGRAELRLESLAITYPDGYIAPISGPVTLESDDGYALKDPGHGRIIGAVALPLAGAGLGTLIGHSEGGTGTNINGMNYNPGGLRDTAIGSMVGLAVGGVASLALILNTHNFFLDVGSPVEMELQQPLRLDQDEVTDPVHKSEKHPVAEQPIVPRPLPPPPPPD